MTLQALGIAAKHRAASFDAELGELGALRVIRCKFGKIEASTGKLTSDIVIGLVGLICLLFCLKDVFGIQSRSVGGIFGVDGYGEHQT